MGKKAKPSQAEKMKPLKALERLERVLLSKCLTTKVKGSKGYKREPLGEDGL